MKKTENRKRKDQYLKQQKILTLFSDPDRIEFEMYEFSKGEIINNII